MEVENISSVINNKEEEDDVPLPGFRFHPTDEELVAFYLKRKVEKRPIGIELIKQADIYKYDPWDLPKGGDVKDKEWYFFCKRGRKYRNSIRPNRVTDSGFWKATGIDRPIYSSSGDCIGLKKSLVYYRGSAGKGTKTDWMMHEFRLPPSDDKINKHVEPKSLADQEAEVWTLCRILKRNVSYKNCRPDWRQVCAKRSISINPVDESSKTCSLESDHNIQSYISFNPPIIQQNEKKPYPYFGDVSGNQQYLGHFSSASQVPPAASSFSSSVTVCSDFYDTLKHADWEDLRSIVDCAADPFYL